MNARMDVACVLLAAVLALGGVWRTRDFTELDHLQAMSSRASIVTAPTLPDADSLGDAAATIVANDPFRLSNKPAALRFLSATASAPVAVPTMPQLTLKAIIGGPPWSAVVEGLPGDAGGVVVTAGLAFDRIHVKRITRESVVMQAPDTTWTLTMKSSP
jgi:hypothetical protein